MTHKTNPFIIKSFILLFFLTASTKAQKTELEEINSFIEKTMNRFDYLPGLTVTIVKDDKTLLSKGYGYSDIKNDIRANSDIPFYIASTTKSFVGMLAAILENEGKIDLSVPLTTYKPFKDLSNKELFESITINELLNHTSGLRNNYLPFRNAYIGHQPHEDMIKLLEEETSLSEKKFEYTNLGYNIFDLLLKEEFGLDWRDLLNEKIFIPLEMHHTSAYISKAISNDWKLAKPYRALQKNGTTESQMKTDNNMHSAGGLVSSGNDLANWLLFNINDGKLNGAQIYPSNIVEKTHLKTISHSETGQIFEDNGYGIGWNTASYKNEGIVYHFGGYTGFFTHISFMPKHNIGIAINANEEMFGDNISNIIAAYIYDLLLGNTINIEEYEQKFVNIEELYMKLNTKFTANRLDKSNREWKLDLPLESYLGIFRSKRFGDMIVTLKNEKPYIKLGELEAIAKPSTQENGMESELIPGRAMNIIFVIDPNNQNQINELKVGGETFERIKN